MAWDRISDAEWARPLSASERTLWLLAQSGRKSGFEEWMLSASAYLSLPTDFKGPSGNGFVRFRHAWKALRFQHPNIAVRIQDEGRKMGYRVPITAAEREEWLDATCFIDFKTAHPDDLCGSVVSITGPTLYVLPRSQAIVILAPHWSCDARGLVQLLGRLADISAAPEDQDDFSWGQETSRLVPAAHELVDMVIEPTQTNDAWLQEQIAGFVKAKPIRTSVWLKGDEQSQPRRPSRLHAMLNQQDTRSVLSACKTRGVSINSAFLAAIARINFDGAQVNYGTEYQQQVRRDLRPKLPEPYDGLASAAAMMVTSTCVSLPVGGNFETLLRQIDAFHKSGYSQEQLKLDSLLLSGVGQLLVQATEAPAPSVELEFSGIGSVDRYFKLNNEDSVSVRGLDFGLNSQVPGIGAWSWTFLDRYNICVSFNESYAYKQDIKDGLTEVLRLLEAGLGLETSLNFQFDSYIDFL